MLAGCDGACSFAYAVHPKKTLPNGARAAPPASDDPGSAFGFTRNVRKVCPASCEAATRKFSSWLNPTYTSAPRTAKTGLSVSSCPRCAHENDHVRPKSSDRATTMSRLLFCSQEAYTV